MDRDRALELTAAPAASGYAQTDVQLRRRNTYCPTRGGHNRTRHLIEPRRVRARALLVAERLQRQHTERAQANAAAAAAAANAASARASNSIFDWPNLDKYKISASGHGSSSSDCHILPRQYERTQLFELVDGVLVDRRAHSLAQDNMERARDREPRIHPVRAAAPYAIATSAPPASRAVSHRLVHASRRVLKSATTGATLPPSQPPPSSATSPLALLASVPYSRAPRPLPWEPASDTTTEQSAAAPAHRAPYTMHSSLATRLAPRLPDHSSALCCQFRERSPSPSGFDVILVLCACDLTFPYLSAHAEKPTDTNYLLAKRIRMDTCGREFDFDPSGFLSPGPGFYATRLRFFEEDWDGIHAKPKLALCNLFFASVDERDRFSIATLRILHSYDSRPTASVSGQFVGFAPTERMSFFAHNLKFQYGHAVVGVHQDLVEPISY